MRSNRGVEIGGVKQPFAVLTPKEVMRVKDRRLLRVFWFTLPLMVIAFLTGVWLVGLTVWSHFEVGSAARGEWEDARSAYANQAALTRSFPEPWLGEYNMGTAALHLGEVDLGVRLLQDAFEGVPKAVPEEDGHIQPFSYECQVRMNLSAGLEMRGDAAAEAGDDEAAIEDSENALSWVKVCEVSSSGSDSDGEDEGEDSGEGQDEGEEGGEGENQGQPEPLETGNPGGEASDRLEEKIDALEGDEGEDEEQDTEPSEGPEPAQDPFEGETDEQREKREDLQQKNRDQEERQREKEESNSRNPGSGGW